MIEWVEYYKTFKASESMALQKIAYENQFMGDMQNLKEVEEFLGRQIKREERNLVVAQRNLETVEKLYKKLKNFNKRRKK